jgi:hypothetical protein
MDTWEGVSSEPNSLHKYTYIHNEPLNRLDPSGHSELLELEEKEEVELAEEVIPLTQPGRVAQALKSFLFVPHHT